jgi:type I restriction enzyme S subunit
VPQKNTVFNLTSTFACYYEQLMQENVDISDEIPFKLPDSWSWCRFSTLVNFVMGKTPARSQKEFWDMPFLPWVSIADMIPGGVIKKTKEFISSMLCRIAFQAEFLRQEPS